MEFVSPSDSRLAARALKEGWPLEPADRQRAIAHLREVVDDPTTRPQLLKLAAKALASVEPTAPDDQAAAKPKRPLPYLNPGGWKCGGGLARLEEQPPASVSDVRLAAKAVQENWSMAPGKRRDAIELLKRVVADATAKPELSTLARGVLATLEPVELTA